MTKQVFYLTKRLLPSGKKVYYWYTYDKKGKRTVPKSTGYSKKQDAYNYCVKLFAQNKLLTTRLKFSDFAENWYDDNSIYMKERQAVKPLKPNTLISFKTNFDKHIFPFFKDYYLDEIDTDVLKEFRNDLIKKGYANSSINLILAALKPIFLIAKEKEKITTSPFSESFYRLQTGRTKKAMEEELLLEILNNNKVPKIYWLLFLTAAVTGLRRGELLGLQKSDIKDNYIDVTKQWSNGEFISLKTKEPRFITIPAKLKQLLLSVPDNEFFIFRNEKDISTPLTYEWALKILRKIIPRSRSVVTLHTFRHFFNTYLISQGISEQKVNFCIGHSSGKGTMLELYTTWRPSMYNDVLELQEKLLDKLLNISPKEYWNEVTDV